MDYFALPIEDDSDESKRLLYRPLLGIACVGNPALAELAGRLLAGEPPESVPETQREAAAFLQQIGFLEPAPPPPAPAREGFAPNTAVLMLTNRCQLRCVYCYAAAGEQPERGLSFESGKAVIEAVAQRAQSAGLQTFDVYFHGGGEPTYHWDVLQRLLEVARAQPIPANCSLTSNAMWSPSQLDWIVSHMDGIGISMDGMPATQNTQRPVKSGQHSSPVVLTNLAELDRCGVTYGIRITAVPPFASLPEDVRFICESMTCNQIIQVEPAYNTARGELSQPEAEQAAQFVNAFVEAHQIAAAHGRSLYYSGARADVTTARFCNAPYDALVVTPDDRLVACYEVVSQTHPLAQLSTIGAVQAGVITLDESKRTRLLDLLDQRRAACRECFCYWTCAGDCFTRAFLNGVDHLAQPSMRCQVNRALTQALLLSQIESGGGVWRRQPSERQIVLEDSC